MRLGRALSPKRPFLGRLDAAVPSPTEPRGRGLPALSAAMLGAALLLASGPAVAQQPGVPVAEPTPAPNPAVPASVAPAATVAPPRAIPPPRRAPSAGFTERLQSIIARASGPQGGTESLVVLSSAPDQKLQVNLREDLAIMARILAKAVDPVQPSDSRVMGVNLAFAQDAGSLRRVYLEGYGALFLFNVGFPLIAPLAADEKGEESPKGNSAWEEARQEVLGEPGPVGMGTAAPPEPYSAEKVDRMKSAILEALKNASNIRGLKNDEGVTVCVLGNQGLPLAHIGGGSMAYAGAGAPAMLAGSGPAAAPSAVLSIRLMKPDIDAFSKGQLDLDQFRKKARITLYATEPGGATVGGFGAGGFGGGGFGGGGGGGGGFGGGR